MRYIIISFLLIGIAACSSSKKALDDTIDEMRDYYDESSLISSSTLQTNRTQLSDAYAYRENKIPESFDRIRVEEDEKDLYEGYRIQIYSGQAVEQADEIAENFETWADTTLSGYQPGAYVFFRTPYYRVHVGDFHERDRAIEFSNMVKRTFPDAWVVYDRVIPTNVPADTVNIVIK